MTHAPDFLRLPLTLHLGDDELQAETLLRHLPGKRAVCAGIWRGREVVAKIYIDPRRKTVHAQREADGVTMLRERGILTPALLHRCQSESMDALIFERLASAETALERWASAQDLQTRAEVLWTLVDTVAQLHQAGLIQEDLHLKNFLFTQAGLYTLDGDSVLVGEQPVEYAQALDNLGLLFAQLHPLYDGLARAIYGDYARVRQWPCTDKDNQALQAAIDRRRAGRKQDYLAKTFRRCSAFETESAIGHFSVWDRQYDSPALRAALEDLDAALKAGRILKKGRSSTVGTIRIDGRELLVKRYNLKNFWHACRRALRETRASVSWRNAHRLCFYGIATPKPVALAEKRWGPLRRTSYFICEYLDAEPCAAYLCRDDVPAAQKQSVIDKICALFAQLGKLRIGHGDTKATNFLASAREVSVIDLDALQEFDDPQRAAAAHEADIARFLRNWDDSPELRAAFEQGLRPGAAQASI